MRVHTYTRTETDTRARQRSPTSSRSALLAKNGNHQRELSLETCTHARFKENTYTWLPHACDMYMFVMIYAADNLLTTYCMHAGVSMCFFCVLHTTCSVHVCMYVCAWVACGFLSRAIRRVWQRSVFILCMCHLKLIWGMTGLWCVCKRIFTSKPTYTYMRAHICVHIYVLA